MLKFLSVVVNDAHADLGQGSYSAYDHVLEAVRKQESTPKRQPSLEIATEFPEMWFREPEQTGAVSSSDEESVDGFGADSFESQFESDEADANSPHNADDGGPFGFGAYEPAGRTHSVPLRAPPNSSAAVVMAMARAQPTATSLLPPARFADPAVLSWAAGSAEAGGYLAISPSKTA